MEGRPAEILYDANLCHCGITHTVITTICFAYLHKPDWRSSLQTRERQVCSRVRCKLGQWATKWPIHPAVQAGLQGIRILHPALFLGGFLSVLVVGSHLPGNDVAEGHDGPASEVWPELGMKAAQLTKRHLAEGQPQAADIDTCDKNVQKMVGNRFCSSVAAQTANW